MDMDLVRPASRQVAACASLSCAVGTGAPLHMAVIDLVSSDDEDPQEEQTAEGTESGLGLPSQVPDSGLEATDAGQRCSQVLHCN